MSSHPLFILIVIFIISIVVIIVIYAANFIVNAMNAAGSSIPGYNTTRINNTYTNVFTITETSFILITIIGMLFDPIIANYKPNKIMGYINILLVFIVPFIYINIKPALVSLQPLTVGTGIVPLMYSFFISVYFISLIEIIIVISTILNFREKEPHEYMQPNTVYQYDRLDR